MKKLITASFLFAFFLTAYSQKVDTTYFDEVWKPCEKSEASFYTVTTVLIQDDTVTGNGLPIRWNVEDYYINGQLKMKGSYYRGLWDGEWTFYGVKGGQIWQGDFVMGKSKDNNPFLLDDPWIANPDYLPKENSSKEVNKSNGYVVKSDDSETFTIVERMPAYPSCRKADDVQNCTMEKLMKHLSSVTYPKLAQQYDIEEKVFMGYVINQYGYVNEINVVRSSAFNLLVEASIKNIETIPRQIPGFQRGKDVKVKFLAPYNFHLQ